VTFASTPRLTATRKRALNKLDLYIGEANMMLEIVTDRVEPGECISAQELIAALIRRDEELGGNFLIRMPLGAEDERKVVLLTQSGMYCNQPKFYGVHPDSGKFILTGDAAEELAARFGVRFIPRWSDGIPHRVGAPSIPGEDLEELIKNANLGKLHSDMFPVPVENKEDNAVWDGARRLSEELAESLVVA
jgi:hypothetical protein